MEEGEGEGWEVKGIEGEKVVAAAVLGDWEGGD